MVKPTAQLTLPQCSDMFIHRHDNYQRSKFKLDNRGSIWLQVRRDEGGYDCCRGHGDIRSPLDDYIYSQGRWFIYYGDTVPGRVHSFMNYFMVHESRQSEPMCRGMVLKATVCRNNDVHQNLRSRSVFKFFKDIRNATTDHVHIKLFYPKGNANTKDWSSDEESETSSLEDSDSEQIPDQISDNDSDQDSDSDLQLEKALASMKIKP